MPQTVAAADLSSNSSIETAATHPLDQLSLGKIVQIRERLLAAQATGKPVVVLQLPGVALDIDRAADLIALAEAAGATRAQQLVRHWQAVERPTDVAVALK